MQQGWSRPVSCVRRSTRSLASAFTLLYLGHGRLQGMVAHLQEQLALGVGAPQ